MPTPEQALWTRVDEYFAGTLLPPDEALDAALRSSAAAGLPPIQISSTQGAFLNLLARVRGARTILEIGTLGGYSTIWLTRALPADGRLVSLELEPRYAELARANLARAGLGELAEVRTGPALETLPRLASEGVGPFDLTFIDADKTNCPAYFAWALRLSKPGSLIVIDNVVREGAVIDETSDDPGVVGVREMLRAIAAEPRVSATAIQTVGVKGWDGLAVVLVVGESG